MPPSPNRIKGIKGFCDLALGCAHFLCPNLTYLNNGNENLGHTIHTYNGIFYNERGKESFYLESILRRLTYKSDFPFDLLKECFIVKTLAMARKCLNNSVCHKLRSRDPFYGGRERTRPVSRRGYHLFMLSPPLQISLSETGLGTRKGNI